MSVRSFKASTRYRSSLGSIEDDAHSYSDEDLETGKLPVCEKGDGSRKDKHPRRKITAAGKEASPQSDGIPQSIGNGSSGNIRKNSDSGKNSTTDKNTSTNNSRHAVADNIWNSYASAFHQKKGMPAEYCATSKLVVTSMNLIFRYSFARHEYLFSFSPVPLL